MYCDNALQSKQNLVYLSSLIAFVCHVFHCRSTQRREIREEVNTHSQNSTAACCSFHFVLLHCRFVHCFTHVQFALTTHSALATAV